MKIIYVGDVNPVTRCGQRLRALTELGHEVVPIPTVPPAAWGGKTPPLWERFLWKLGRSPDVAGANAELARQVRTLAPDLIWVDKGNQVRAATLRDIKRHLPGVPLVGYSEDDMWSTRNRSIEFARGLRYYDVFFTPRRFNCDTDELPSLGAKRVMTVDLSYAPALHRPIEISPADRLRFGAEVGFIGYYEAARARSIAYLAKHGVPVRVWGGGPWHRMRGSRTLLAVEGRQVLGEDYVKALCSTKVNLCFLRKSNRDLQVARTTEIPACGAFMLAERTSDHERLFVDGREVVLFTSDGELLEKAHYYLAHDDERIAIGVAGRSRCLKSGYSHHEVLQQMILSAIGVKP